MAFPNDVPPHDTGTWTQALPEDILWDGDMIGVDLRDTEVLLINLDGEIRAYHNRCPHQRSPLDEGWVEDGTLTCSRHLWEFDVLTGRGVNPRNCALISYPVRVEGGMIWVSVP